MPLSSLFYLEIYGCNTATSTTLLTLLRGHYDTMIPLKLDFLRVANNDDFSCNGSFPELVFLRMCTEARNDVSKHESATFGDVFTIENTDKVIW